MRGFRDPDPYSFLHSAIRELQGPNMPEADPYQTVRRQRLACTLERLAFREAGLQDVVTELLPIQRQLVRRTGRLISSDQDPVAEFLENRDVLDAWIRAGDLEKEASVDLVADISRFDHEMTDALATASRKAAVSWQAGRPSGSELIDDAALTAYLRDKLPEYQALTAHNVQLLGGLHANEAYSFEQSGHPKWPQGLILRRMLEAQIAGHLITEEFDILLAVQGAGLPVPAPILADAAPPGLGRPVLIVEKLDGATQDLTGAGRKGQAVFQRLAALLGHLHRLNPAILPEGRRAGRRSTQEWLHFRIDKWEREWLRATREPVLTVSAAFRWLRDHAADFVAHQVIVHGDLDQRNILVDGTDIVALIDWEQAHQGHPAEDLAYVRAQVEALMPWGDFLAIYRAHGGADITEAELRYGAVLCNMLRVTTSMAAYRAYVDGQIDNVLMGTVRPLETERACQELHEAIYGTPATLNDRKVR